MKIIRSHPWGWGNPWEVPIHRIVTFFPDDPLSAKLKQKYIILHFWELHIPNPQRPMEGQRPCLESQHSVSLNENTLWSANHQHQKARMPWGEESISCAWQSWEDSWRKLGGWSACVEGLRTDKLSRAKSARARVWWHYFIDKTSHPPGWTKRGADVWGLLREDMIIPINPQERSSG